MTPLGIFAILLCVLNAQINEGSFPDENDFPSGRYRSQFWTDSENVVNTVPGEFIFELRRVTRDTYNGSWVGTGTTFNGFYSSNSNTLTGTWYASAFQTWGSMYYYWNGVSFSGRSTFSHNETIAYEVLLPVDSNYELPATNGESSEDTGK